LNTPNSMERRLLLALAGIACVAILGVVAILPYRLYQRDIRHAQVQAHRISSVAHAALSNAVSRGDDVGDLTNRLQGIGDFELRLTRLEPGEVGGTANSGRGTSDLDGTTLTYTAAPIVGPKGESWLSTMTFDLRSMKRESVRLIIDLMLAVLLGSLVFSGVVYGLVRATLLEPLHEVTRRISALDAEDAEVTLPEYRTTEMAALARAIEHACHTRGPTAGTQAPGTSA
jgi:hypothetical protein